MILSIALRLHPQIALPPPQSPAGHLKGSDPSYSYKGDIIRPYPPLRTQADLAGHLGTFSRLRWPFSVNLSRVWDSSALHGAKLQTSHDAGLRTSSTPEHLNLHGSSLDVTISKASPGTSND
ncbi:hypothetical protein AOLI_G00271040 [Acnodon oligacanthus]